MRTSIASRRLALGLGTIVVAGAVTAAIVTASDHRDSTLLTANPNVDIADVYTFTSPTNPNNVVLAMTVAGFIPPTENGTHFFEPGALYQIKIDNNGDAVEDLVIQAVVSSTTPVQRLKILGPSKPILTGSTSQLVKNSQPIYVTVSASEQARIVRQRDLTVFAGLRDDPFFFDLAQFSKVVSGLAPKFNNPGTDAFAGFNVLAIVVELPASLLGGPNIGVWGTTSRLR